MLTVSELVGFNAGLSDLSFSNAWSAQSITPTNGGQFNGYTLVNKFLPGALSGGGSTVRVSVWTWTTAPFVIAALYIGHAATSGYAYDFDGNQVELLFGGGSGTTIPAGGTNTSDPTSFGLDAERALLVAMDVTTATASNLVSGLGSNFISYWKPSSAQAGTTLKSSGYSSSVGDIYTTFKIEVA